MSSEEKKAFRIMLVLGTLILFLGICIGMLIQRNYVKLMQKEETSFADKQATPEIKGNIQMMPENNPRILRDKKGNVLNFPM